MMMKKTFSILKTRTLLLAAALLFTCSAVAQDAAPPSDAQLQAPKSSAPAQQPAQMPSPNAMMAGAQTGDPCPAPAAAIRNAPDDLARVQEDIDRFTLCVQRAQLLERLNESALKNQTSGDMALGLKAPMPSVPGLAGAQTNTDMMMPPLPANALAGADVSPLGTPAPTTGNAAAPAPETASAEPEKEKETPKEWTIREISGSGNAVQAKLLSPEGDEVKATSGMKLPDGKTTVVRITPAGVTVREAGRAKTLEWAKS